MGWKLFKWCLPRARMVRVYGLAILVQWPALGGALPCALPTCLHLTATLPSQSHYQHKAERCIQPAQSEQIYVTRSLLQSAM